jgi:hypothetical protein
MGRREDRAALESTWAVLEPAVPGTPFRKADMYAATVRELVERLALSDHGAMLIDAATWHEMGADIQRLNPRVRYDETRGVMFEDPS